MSYKRIVHIKQEPLTFFCLPLGSWRCFKNLGKVDFHFSEVNYIDGDIYLLEKELKYLLGHLRDNPKKLNEIIRLMRDYNERFIKFCIENSNREDILEAFREFIEIYNEAGGIALWMIGGEAIAKEIVEEELKKIMTIDEKKLGEMLLTIASDTRDSFTIKERKALLNLAKYKSFDLLSDSQEIDEHLKQYSWLNVNFFRHTPYTREEIFERLKNIGNPEEELKKIEAYKEKLEEEYNKIVNEFNFNEETRRKMEILREFVFLRTERIESLNFGIFNMYGLVSKIADKIKIERDLIIFMTPEEIFHALNGENIPMNLEKRKEAYAILANNGKIEIIDSKEEISRLHNRFEEKKERQKIIGVIASKGIVQGKVKTIRSKDEHFKIKKGDILVTEMTTPDFLIAMEKSAAIVTDIGGITSHAAIVARELGIPCIVGTENATNLLKDGDFVVVDAIDKGEVIKIDAPCIIS